MRARHAIVGLLGAAVVAVGVGVTPRLNVPATTWDRVVAQTPRVLELEGYDELADEWLRDVCAVCDARGIGFLVDRAIDGRSRERVAATEALLAVWGNVAFWRQEIWGEIAAREARLRAREHPDAERLLTLIEKPWFRRMHPDE